MAFMKDFEYLKIQMKDILSATNNFDRTKVIGGGGFGKVYKGDLSLPEGQITVAFKQLDRRMGQGNTEFWREIMMLSKYKHENLISLMHFCIEGNEMILVYEYASHGSLDRYLSDATLTWTQRLNISVGAARGLSFLHDPMGKQHRVIHRDVKSSNILLDEKWTAKVSDFGLSKVGPANQEQTYMVSNLVGTPGYCDPLYLEMGFLSKESDVYSFGVVLFEILCGRLCVDYRNGKLSEILVPKWKQCYVAKNLDEIILTGLKEQMDPGSLNSFSAIAYRCVKKAREERPTMTEIVKELEFALEQQKILENLGKRVDFAELMRMADLAIPPLAVPRNQHPMLLLKGFLVDDGETWVRINMKGEVTKVVSATKCFLGDKLVLKETDVFVHAGCKFPYYLWNVYTNRFRVEVNTRYLSQHVTYTIYIVFQHCGRCAAPFYVPFEYKLDVETQYSTSCIAYAREHHWVMTKLYQFTSHPGQQNFSIEFLPRDQIAFDDEFAFEGIEFRPLENETCEKQEDKIKVDSNFEPKLGTDLIELSKDVIQWTTKKELYFLLRKGFLIDGEKWFSISKDMKKRVMIAATTFLAREEWRCNSIPELESRFKVVTKSVINHWFTIYFKGSLKNLLPHEKASSCHLIYKLSHNEGDGPMVIGINDGFRSHMLPLSICLNTRCHPPIIGACNDNSPSTCCKMKDGHPKLRKDGWMEVEFTKALISYTGTAEEYHQFTVMEEKFQNMKFFGIIIQGMEFRAL